MIAGRKELVILIRRRNLVLMNLIYLMIHVRSIESISLR